jgi:hypothetical protein
MEQSSQNVKNIQDYKNSDLYKAIVNAGKSNQYLKTKKKLENDRSLASQFISSASKTSTINVLMNQYSLSYQEILMLRDSLKVIGDHASVDKKKITVTVEGNRREINDGFTTKSYIKGIPESKEKPGKVSLSEVNKALIDTALSLYKVNGSFIELDSSVNTFPPFLRPDRASALLAANGNDIEKLRDFYYMLVGVDEDITAKIAKVAPPDFRPTVMPVGEKKLALIPSNNTVKVTENTYDVIVNCASRMAKKSEYCKIARAHYTGVDYGNTTKYVEDICDLKPLIDQVEGPIYLHTSDRMYGVLFGNHYKGVRKIYIEGNINNKNNDLYSYFSPHSDNTAGFHVFFKYSRLTIQKDQSPWEIYGDNEVIENKFFDKYPTYVRKIFYYSIDNDKRYYPSCGARNGTCWVKKGDFKGLSVGGASMKKHISQVMMHWMVYPWLRAPFCNDTIVDMDGVFDFTSKPEVESSFVFDNDGIQDWMELIVVDDDNVGKKVPSTIGDDPPSSDSDGEYEEVEEEKLVKKKSVVSPESLKKKPPDKNKKIIAATSLFGSDDFTYD